MMRSFIVTLVFALTQTSSQSDVIQPMTYFYHANNIPYKLYSRYLCHIFRKHEGKSSTDGQSVRHSNYQALEDLVTSFAGHYAHASMRHHGYITTGDSLPTSYGESSDFIKMSESLKNALTSELNVFQLYKLRSALQTSLTLCDLKLLIKLIYGTQTEKALEALYLVQPFLVQDNVSTFDRQRPLAEIIVASNGLQKKVPSNLHQMLAVDDILGVAFSNMLPLELEREERDDALIAMIVLSKLKLTRLDIETLFNNCSQDLFNLKNDLVCKAVHSYLDSLQKCGLPISSRVQYFGLKCETEHGMTSTSTASTPNRTSRPTLTKNTATASSTNANVTASTTPTLITTTTLTNTTTDNVQPEFQLGLNFIIESEPEPNFEPQSEINIEPELKPESEIDPAMKSEHDSKKHMDSTFEYQPDMNVDRKPGYEIELDIDQESGNQSESEIDQGSGYEMEFERYQEPGNQSESEIDQGSGYEMEFERYQEAGNQSESEIDQESGYENDFKHGHEYQSEGEIDQESGYEIDSEKDEESGYEIDSEKDEESGYEIDLEVNQEPNNKSESEINQESGYEIDLKHEPEYQSKDEIDQESGYEIDPKIDQELGYEIDSEIDQESRHEIDPEIDQESGYEIDPEIDQESGYEIEPEIDQESGYEIDPEIDQE